MKLARALLAALALAGTRSVAQDYDELRRRMVAEVSASARDVLPGGAAFDPRVLAAMGRVPRHVFVPPGQRSRAYENRPLPVGHDQTISQPTIVALMTHLLRPAPEHRVLEVGTGSGYQAAVLAELVRTVYSIEIVEPLGRGAAAALREAGYSNVRTRIGDGYAGWPGEAPFDAIIVTAAATEVPEPLVAQLRPGGRLVIPLGRAGDVQQLVTLEKLADGSVRRSPGIAVRFVPLTRGR